MIGRPRPANEIFAPKSEIALQVAGLHVVPICFLIGPDLSRVASRHCFALDKSNSAKKDQAESRSQQYIHSCPPVPSNVAGILAPAGSLFRHDFRNVEREDEQAQVVP